MGYETSNNKNISCGCYEYTKNHDFFNGSDTYYHLCKKHQDEENIEKEKIDKIKQIEKEKIDQFLDFFKLQSVNLEYYKIPIKYNTNIRIIRSPINYYDPILKTHINDYKFEAVIYIKNPAEPFYSINCKELFKIEKIKNRYYCCKNRIDLFNKDNIIT
jgi:hypothetical protein